MHHSHGTRKSKDIIGWTSESKRYYERCLLNHIAITTKKSERIQVAKPLVTKTKMDDSNELQTLEVPHLWNVDRNLVLLETNIDDMTAEQLGFATEQLLAMGAACRLLVNMYRHEKAKSRPYVALSLSRISTDGHVKSHFLPYIHVGNSGAAK
jgi:uncharacterized protein (DUF111 family)